MKRFIVFSCLFLLVVGFAKPAMAISAPLNATVMPTFFDLVAQPGDVIKNKIRLHNNNNEATKLVAEVAKLAPDKDGNLTVVPPEKNDEFVSWLKFDSAHFTAGPGQWADIPFTITIPNTAAFGYYYAVSVREDAPTATGENVTSFSAAVMVPILLNVKKDGAQASASLLDFSVPTQVFESLPVDFSVKLVNQGNIHLRPHGNIFISSPTDKNVATLEVNPELGNIIPSANRTFHVVWDDGFLVGDKINWDKLTKFRFGPYSASLAVTYDNGKQDVLLEKSLKFYIFPYKAVAVVLIAILGLLLLGYTLLKRYVAAQIRKARPS